MSMNLDVEYVVYDDIMSWIGMRYDICWTKVVK